MNTEFEREFCPLCLRKNPTAKHQAECDGMPLPTTPDAEPFEVEPELAPEFEKAPPPPPVTVFGERNLPLALISDIDLTIAFIPLNEEGGLARSFNDFAKSGDDVPNNKVVALIKAWYDLTESPTIYFVTNRDVKWRDVTVRWLVRFFPPASYKWVLRMRPANDFYSSAAAIKEAHLVNEISKKHSVQQVWEDDDECIAMYRSHGLTTLDAKETWPK
jgi:hypothetical protein